MEKEYDYECINCGWKGSQKECNGDECPICDEPLYGFVVEDYDYIDY
jgi:rubrerythrin